MLSLKLSKVMHKKEKQHNYNRKTETNNDDAFPIEIKSETVTLDRQ